MEKFRLIVSSDQGTYKAIVIARNAEAAIKNFCAAEGCPESAIISHTLYNQIP